MGNLERKLEEIIQSGLKGATLELEWIPQSEKLSGLVVWDGFYGKTQRERQKELMMIVRNELTEEEQRSLSIILTLTPAEDKTYREESVRL
jgi:hypothetical protein